MNYFVFGGSGFIGTHLINLLYDKYPNSNIYNLDIKENNHSGKSQYINCDVRKTIQINVDSEKTDVIYNFAAIHVTPGHQDYDYFETNIKGAENVTQFAEVNGISKIVFTSSIAPYGASEDIKTEATLPTPSTPYGISKLVAEKIHTAWQYKNSVARDLVIVRPGVVFGKGENGNFTRLYWGIKNNRFLYPGRKDTIKSCIYVKDLVSFMNFEINKGNKSVEIYNCSYFPAYTIEQIANTMMKVTGLKKKIIKLSGSLLKIAASVIGALGGRKIGIHPDRVQKLMISTNVSGEKLSKSNYQFLYTFEEAINDWYNDNNREFLK